MKSERERERERERESERERVRERERELKQYVWVCRKTIDDGRNHETPKDT